MTSNESVGATANKYDLKAGLTKCQKKNLRKILRAQNRKEETEKKTKETDEQCEEDICDLPKDKVQPFREEVLKEVQDEMSKLVDLKKVDPKDLGHALQKQKQQIMSLKKQLEEASQKYCRTKIPYSTRNSSESDIISSIKKLSSDPDADPQAKSYYKEQYEMMKSWKNGKKMLEQYRELEAKLDKQLESLTQFNQNRPQQHKWAYVLPILKECKIKKKQTWAEDTSPSSIQSIDPSEVPAGNMSSIVNNGLLRHMERLFCVVFAKRGAGSPTQRIHAIAGLKEDLDKFKEYMNSVDLSESRNLKVSRSTLRQLLGPSGSNVQKLENFYHCLIKTQQDDAVMILGNKQNLDQLQAHIEQELSTNVNTSPQNMDIVIQDPAVAKCLSQHYHFNLLQKCGAEGVSIRQSGTKIFVRGNNVELLKEVAQKINELIATLIVKTIEAPSTEILKYLVPFSRQASEKTATKQQNSASSPFVKDLGRTFQLFMDAHPEVTFISTTSTCLTLIGKAEDIAACEPTVSDMFRKAAFTSLSAKIPSNMRYFLKQDTLLVLESEFDVIIQRPVLSTVQTEESVTYEIYGDEEKKKRAYDRIMDIIKEKSHKKKISFQSREPINMLFKNGSDMLFRTQEMHDVKITVNTKDEEPGCTIMGSEKSVECVASLLMSWDSDHVPKSFTQEIAIPSNEVANHFFVDNHDVIHRVIAETGANSITLNKNKKSCKIMSTTSKTCDRATAMLSDLIKEFEIQMKDKALKKKENPTLDASTYPDLFPAIDEAIERKTPAKLTGRRFKISK